MNESLLRWISFCFICIWIFVLLSIFSIGLFDQGSSKR